MKKLTKHHSTNLSIALIIITSLVSLQCSSDTNSPKNVRELTSLEKDLVTSNNLFGLKLFRKMNEAENTDNIFISPLSVSMALGMTLNGACGVTFDSMKSTLEFEGLSVDEINGSYRSLIDLLKGLDGHVVFQLANSIWYNKKWHFEKKFITDNETYFDAVIYAADFASPRTTNLINNWVKNKTNGKIEQIIDQVTPETVMLLLNAIYFKGTWTYEFDKQKTRDDKFTKLDGSQVPCKMMSQSGSFGFFYSNNAEAVDLPYGDGDFRMTLLIPNSTTTIDELVAAMSQENWDTWLKQFTNQNGLIEIPKFTFQYKIEMKNVLESLGMHVAFTPGSADFTGMDSIEGRQLYIDKVTHKTFLEVSEEGTEAAAVTSVGIGVTSGTGGRGFLFRVDCPFLVVIRENHSNTILFIGKILEPLL